MEEKAIVKRLDKIIVTTRQEIKVNLMLFGIAFCCGIAGICASFFGGFQIADLGKSISSVPGIIVAALGLYPIKDHFSKVYRIDDIEFNKTRFKAFKKNPESFESNEAQEIKERIREIINKYSGERL